MVTPPPPIPNTPILEPPLPEAHTSGPIRTQRQSTTARMRTGPMSAALKAHVAKQMAKGSSKTPRMPAGEVSVTLKVTTDNHWGRGHLETGDYMLGTFRAHVHLSHNVTSG